MVVLHMVAMVWLWWVVQLVVVVALVVDCLLTSLGAAEVVSTLVSVSVVLVVGRLVLALAVLSMVGLAVSASCGRTRQCV